MAANTQTSAAVTHELWTVSAESAQDFVCGCPFSHLAAGDSDTLAHAGGRTSHTQSLALNLADSHPLCPYMATLDFVLRD